MNKKKLNQLKLSLRYSVRNFYDIQRTRLAVANRMPKKGQKLDLDKSAIKELQYHATKWKEDEERILLKEIIPKIEEFPIWTEFLKDVKGCGPTMSAVLISSFDIYKDTVSKWWAYCGLSMERQYLVSFKDSKKGKVKEQTVWATSESNAKKVIPMPKNKKINRIFLSLQPVNGKLESQRLKGRKGQYPTYNTDLKPKMVGVLGPSFLMSNSPYRKFYDDYKHRKESQKWGGYKDEETGKLKSIDGHRHNASIRYMVKMFLKDVYLKWRELEKLPIRPSYQEEYLGHKHKG